MTTRRLVDVIVLGGKVAPLSAACLLARRGYKVLHVQHEGGSSHYTDGDFRLPLEPDFVPGPKSSPAITRVLKELALLTDAQRLLRPIAPDLQIISPGHRFELPGESSRRVRELSREFGDDEARQLEGEISSLLESDKELDPLLEALPPLPPSGFMERRALRKASAGLPLEGSIPFQGNCSPLGIGFDGLARVSTYLLAPNPSHLHSVRSRARLLRAGIHRFEDMEGESKGRGYLPLLKRRLEELGGVSLAGGGAVVEEILLEGGRVAGLKVIEDSTDYRCRYLVSGVDTAVLNRLLPLKGRRHRYDADLDRVRPREILFSVNLVLARRGLPPGLGELAVHVGKPDGGSSETERILLETFEALDKEDKPIPDLVVLQASCFMPASRRELGESYLEGLRDRVLDTLKADLLPFLDRHLVLASSPLLTHEGSARGSRFLPHPLFESDIDAVLGVGLLRPRTPYKNLILASREVLPGLGLEGEFFSGHRAAEIVAHSARRHDPLKDQ